MVSYEEGPNPSVEADAERPIDRLLLALRLLHGTTASGAYQVTGGEAAAAVVALVERGVQEQHLALEAAGGGASVPASSNALSRSWRAAPMSKAAVMAAWAAGSTWATRVPQNLYSEQTDTSRRLALASVPTPTTHLPYSRSRRTSGSNRCPQ